MPDTISIVADLYKNKNTFYSVQEINSLYNITLLPRQLSKIKNTINETANSLDTANFNWQQRPRQSLLLKIALKNRRGCREFYDLFRARQNKHDVLRNYEVKWNLRLGQTLPINFWASAWSLHARIKQNNQFKWLQCQILRHSLYTNNRVCKFKPEVSELCDLCNLHVENPLTLFWECRVSQQLWSQVGTFFADHTIHIPDSRLGILFGFSKEPWDSIINTAVMIGKQVIWTSKVKKQLPTLAHFKRLLKYHLVLLKYCSTIESDQSIYKPEWNDILLDISQDGSGAQSEDGQ